jgi:hypothetical protein
MQLKLLKKSKRYRQDAGIALLTTILLLFLMSSLLVGFAVLLLSNQQLAGSSNDQVVAFYAAEAGMEKMTADLGGLFSQTYSPSIGQIDGLETAPYGPPVSTLFPNETVNYTTADGTAAYTITPSALDANGNPAATITTIKSGPYQGMTAMATTYTLSVNARTGTGREVNLIRTTQTVGIPMFQFAIFCEVDCAFHAGSNYTVNGRVHGNGNLFLGSGATLTMEGKVDAYKDIIRAYMDNGLNTQANWGGNVSITTTPTGGGYRNLAFTEGSYSGSGCISTWDQVSTGSSPTDYASELINGKGSPSCAAYSTGAQQLNLAVVTMGGGTTQPIDLLRRPKVGESSNVTGERYFAQSSLAILLSDNPTDIMSLPCVDQTTQPMDLSVLAQSNWWNATALANLPAQYTTLYNKMVAYGTIPLPLATSGASPNAAAFNPADGYWLPANYPIVKGYIKIQAQTAYGAPCGTWQDVTAEILALGYAGANINPTPQVLTTTKLNAEWPGVGGSWGGEGTSSCTSQTSCAQMDPLQGVGNGYLFPAAVLSASTAYSAIAAKQVQMSLCTTTTAGCLTTYNGPGYPLPNPGAAQIGPQNQIASTTVLTSTSAMPSTSATLYTGQTGRCLDPHPNAVIRLERIRDNPSSLYAGNPSNSYHPYVASGTFSTTAIKEVPVAVVCGVDPVTGKLPIVYDQAGNQGVWTPQPWDFWNNEVFDPREGELRDIVPTGNYANLPTLNGGMHYIELDVKNLAKWFAGAIGTSGQSTYDNVNAPNDFSVYISDRRGNYLTPATVNFTTWPPLSPTGHETGEYGWDDVVNSPTTNGCPDNTLETGEDLDGINLLLTYGANSANINYIMDPGATPTSLYSYSTSTPAYITGTNTTGGMSNTGAYGEFGFYNNLVGAVNTGAIYANPNCANPAYATAAPAIWPMMYASQSNALRENPPIFFRRAVKIVDANNLTGLGTCPTGVLCGLAIATENPVYLQGDYNSDYTNPGTSGFGDTSVGSSIAGDAVAILSNSWNDVNSFSFALYANGGNARTPNTTYWRAAIIAGKGVSFPNFGASADTGTDGGMHNFLRELENWGATSNTVNYEGALVNLFTDRQADGFFKYGNTVYTVPTRFTTFDSNFLIPADLPPRTPMFREINTTGWTRMMAPTSSYK